MIKITIDLGNGYTENIFVQKGEEHRSQELAREFCARHGFDERIEQALAEQIEANVKAVIISEQIHEESEMVCSAAEPSSSHHNIE